MQNLESASLSEDMSSWTTGTMPAVVALCRMEMVSMKSGKAPRNLPTRSRAELSPSSFCVGREGSLLRKKDEQFVFYE